MRRLSIVLFSCMSLSFAGTDNTASPFRLSMAADGAVLLGAAGVYGIGAYSESNVNPWKAEDITALNRGDINGFDRPATSNWSKDAAAVSNFTVAACMASPAILVFSAGARRDYFTLGVLYAETMGITQALISMAKGFAERSRPYTYNPAVPLGEKLAADSRKSFFSAHTANAFAPAVFLCAVYGDYFPGSKLKVPVQALSLSAAAVTGYLRFRAGKHFPTDILTGAAVGSAAGYFVPYFHRRNESPVKISLSCTNGTPQIGITRSF